MLSAIAGAAPLGSLALFEHEVHWSLGSVAGMTDPLKLTIGALMVLFALFEPLPRFQELQFDRRWLPLGGVLSGFFGGLSGHQGALRSAFLVKTGLTTQAFVGTSCVIGLMVDLVRIITYLALLALASGQLGLPQDSLGLVATGVLAAFSGVLIGKRFLHKVRMSWIQHLTGVLLLLIAVLLGLGLI